MSVAATGAWVPRDTTTSDIVIAVTLDPDPAATVKSVAAELVVFTSPVFVTVVPVGLVSTSASALLAPPVDDAEEANLAPVIVA